MQRQTKHDISDNLKHDKIPCLINFPLCDYAFIINPRKKNYLNQKILEEKKLENIRRSIIKVNKQNII